MAEILLISEDYFKKLAGVDENVDWDKLESTVVMVQDIYIQKILGTPLFNDIKAKIDIDESLSTQPVYKALLNDYISKPLAWYIKMEASPSFRFAYQNKGIQVKNSDTSEAAPIDEVKYLMDKWRINAEAYAEILTKHLQLNASLYPKYYEYINDGMSPAKKNYTIGIMLRNPSGNGC